MNCPVSAKIRRLYDIANILTSLDLIRKVHVTQLKGRKPAFKYIGPDVQQASHIQGEPYPMYMVVPDFKGNTNSTLQGCQSPTGLRKSAFCTKISISGSRLKKSLISTICSFV